MKQRQTCITFLFPVFSFVVSSFAQPRYEFRAVWIATVNNIDWPSAKGLPVVTQKAEYIAMLDSLQKIGINAVVVQVRPQQMLSILHSMSRGASF